MKLQTVDVPLLLTLPAADKNIAGVQIRVHEVVAQHHLEKRAHARDRDGALLALEGRAGGRRTSSHHLHRAE